MRMEQKLTSEPKTGKSTKWLMEYMQYVVVTSPSVAVPEVGDTVSTRLMLPHFCATISCATPHALGP